MKIRHMAFVLLAGLFLFAKSGYAVNFHGADITDRDVPSSYFKIGLFGFRPTVADINFDSPAAKHGLQSGDIIISVNGKEIKRSAELNQFTTELLSVSIFRGSERMRLNIAAPVAKQINTNPTSDKKPTVTQPQIVSKVPAVEVKSAPTASKVPEAEIKSPPAVSKVPEAEIKSPLAVSKVPAVEAKSPPAAGKSPVVDVKSPQAENNVPVVMTKPPHKKINDIKIESPAAVRSDPTQTKSVVSKEGASSAREPSAQSTPTIPAAEIVRTPEATPRQKSPPEKNDVLSRKIKLVQDQIVFENTKGEVKFTHSVHRKSFNKEQCMLCHQTDKPAYDFVKNRFNDQRVAHGFCRGCHQNAEIAPAAECQVCHNYKKR